MQVVYFQRKRRAGSNFSLEFIFNDVRHRLKDRIQADVHIAPCLSNGLIRRLWITLDARRHQGRINHVTGDINFAAIGLDPRRTVLTILDCGFLNRPRSLRRWLLKKFWLDLPARSATVITTISEAARREIISWLGCSEDKVVVIPVAVSDNYQPVPREFQAECPRILQVGTAPNKNLLRSIEALRGIPCCLVIVGRLDPVVLETLGANSVHYENFVSLSSEKLLHQYHTSDIVLFPSTYEGFGMPIVEGQRVGRPVITSNISSMPEVAGRGAELVDPFSVDSIRQGILKVIQDRDHRDRLIHEGFQNATRFDAQRIADRYFEVYQTIESSSDFLKEKALD